MPKITFADNFIVNLRMLKMFFSYTVAVPTIKQTCLLVCEAAFFTFESSTSLVGDSSNLFLVRVIMKHIINSLSNFNFLFGHFNILFCGFWIRIFLPEALNAGLLGGWADERRILAVKDNSRPDVAAGEPAEAVVVRGGSTDLEQVTRQRRRRRRRHHHHLISCSKIT